MNTQIRHSIYLWLANKAKLNTHLVLFTTSNFIAFIHKGKQRFRSAELTAYISVEVNAASAAV